MKNIFLKMIGLTFLSWLVTSALFAQSSSILVKNVNIIPMTNPGLVLENQSLVVEKGKIVKIGKSTELKAPTNAEIIDGEGAYLIPGLTEMHAHIPPKRQGDELIEETLFLYLSNGVTTIRGMLGEPYHLELKQAVADDEILGPRIYTSGPSLNGNSVKSTEAAQKMVADQKKAGYDFLKLHPGLTLPIFDEIVKTANEVGIPYSGHVSIDVGVRHALESKYASIDHVDGYVEGLVALAKGVDPNENGFFGINFTDIADRDQISELVKLTGDNDVWIVPTQSLMERWVGPEDATKLGSGEAMKYMSPQTVKRWVDTKIAYTSRADYSKEKAQRFVELRAEIIKSLNEGGVGILLGSDAPQVFNVPGFSIQNELESMVKSGLSNYEALESGTANPAKFFDAVGTYGTIVEGSSADFILLTNNPLESISNTRYQIGVMVRGKWLSSEYIEERLKKIADKYEAQN